MKISLFQFAVLVLLVLAGIAHSAAGAASTAGACDLTAKNVDLAGSGCAQAWFDANLHINEMQAVGTSESYKLPPGARMLSLIRMGSQDDANALGFGEPALSDQLAAGARSFEFDVAYDPKGGLFKYPAGAAMTGVLMPDDYVAAMSKPGFKVLHVFDIDFNSSCLELTDCLRRLAVWSRANPDHVPIIVGLKCNDNRTPMPGATHPLKFDKPAFDALDAAILSVFKPQDLITPAMVQGHYPSLHAAIAAGNWPTLGAARGKMIFFLDDTPDKVSLYHGPHGGLKTRVMFVNADEKSPLAAIITIENPVKEGPRIAAAIKAGLIVHTYADADAVEAHKNITLRRDRALASGAQMVSTDFITADKAIGPYQVRLPGNLRARCNPLFSPQRCAGRDLEETKARAAAPNLFPE